ncbi:MAG: DUF4962 domain-containing protein [Balneolaceae bacterium]
MNRLILFILALCISGCSSTNSVHAGNGRSASDTVSTPPDLIPYTLFDDFETGEKYGWEAYPYEQDVGTTRHFFTRESPSLDNSRYALHRPMPANDGVELYNGFTKRLNIWTTPETRLQVAVFLQGDRNPQTLEISLGTFDGRRYMHTIENPEANQWLELNIPARAFRMDGEPLGPGENIQVVTLKGSYDTVYYLTNYTMVMDNFTLNGKRQRRFVASNPVSTDFEMFDTSILNKHFFYGETISLSITPEEGTQQTRVSGYSTPIENLSPEVSLRRVAGTLIDGDGQLVRENIPFDYRNGVWVNDSIHQVQNGDARGQWEIRLTGHTYRGTEVRWGFRFLVPGSPVNQHPRLFFTADELEQRLSSEDSPVAQGILDRALEDTDFMDIDIDSVNEYDDVAGEAMAGGPYGKYSYGFRASGLYRNPMRTLGEVIEEGSFRYSFTGDRAAGEKAKEALLKLCSFERWSPRWMYETHNWQWYPSGYTMKPVAKGYDMLYHLLSEEEREFVRDAIVEKGLKLYHRDMVEMNRMPSNVTNHMAVLSAGNGLAAAAIYGDDPENPYMEPFLSGVMTKAKTFIDRTYYEDGSYGEPYSYMDMASRSLIEIVAVFERNFGVDWTTTTDMQNFYKYPLRATGPDNLMHSWGDTGRSYSGFNQIHSWWFVHKLGNPYVYDYVKPYWEEGNGGYMSYLWFRDDITPVSRNTFPTSGIYDAQGMVMRSGWEDESTIITTRVGPNSNHYHYDQGSFQLMTNGEELLTDPGVGSGGYYGGLFTVYDIHSIAHNVMLVDHDSESQVPAHYDIGIEALKDWPEMTHAFAGEIADAIEGDLASVYKNKLKNYTRTLLYTKSGPLFLFDRVESNSPEGHVYNWLFHAPQNDGNERSIRFADVRMTVERPQARLTMDVISPEIESSRITDRNDDRFPESWLTLNSPKLAETTFLAVLIPEARSSGGSYQADPQTSRIDGQGWIGARVERPDAVDLGFFRTTGDAAASIEGYTTDASRFTVSSDGSGNLLKVYFEGSSFEGEGLTVDSNGIPLTCAMARNASGLELEIQTDQATDIRFSTSGQPAQVMMDGEEITGWDYDSRAQMLVVGIPAGRHDLTVR